VKPVPEQAGDVKVSEHSRRPTLLRGMGRGRDRACSLRVSRIHCGNYVQFIRTARSRQALSRVRLIPRRR
jgi:hypothetical protein